MGKDKPTVPALCLLLTYLLGDFKMTVDDAIKNVSLVLTKHRGKVDGKILNAEEQLGIMQSYRLMVDAITQGQDAIRELAELKARPTKENKPVEQD